MAAYNMKTDELTPADKLAYILFSDYKKEPTKSEFSIYLSKKTLAIIDQMRSRARKIVSAKKTSRNDVIKKITNYCLKSDSKGYLQLEEIINFKPDHTGEKKILTVQLPIEVVNMLDLNIDHAKKLTDKKISRSLFMENMINLAEKKSK